MYSDGLASSYLQGLNWMELVALLSSVVMKSSVCVLFQSLSAIVRILKGYFLFTSLMMWKKSSGKYGGSWLGTPGTSIN